MNHTGAAKHEMISAIEVLQLASLPYHHMFCASHFAWHACREVKPAGIQQALALNISVGDYTTHTHGLGALLQAQPIPFAPKVAQDNLVHSMGAGTDDAADAGRHLLQAIIGPAGISDTYFATVGAPGTQHRANTTKWEPPHLARMLAAQEADRLDFTPVRVTMSAFLEVVEVVQFISTGIIDPLEKVSYQ